MPPFALVLCAGADILGTLAETAPTLPVDARALVAAGLVALGAFALSGACKAPQFRALLAASLIASAANAARITRSQPEIAAQRTASYGGVALERTPAGFVAAIDRGVRVVVHVTGEAPAPGSRIVVRGRLTPFDDARNPGEPSERATQRDRGLDAQIESAAVLSVASGSPWDARAWPARAHEWAHAQLASHLGEPGASVVAGECHGASVPPCRPICARSSKRRGPCTCSSPPGCTSERLRRSFSERCRCALSSRSRVRSRSLRFGGFAWCSGDALTRRARRNDGDGGTLRARLRPRDVLPWNALAMAAVAIAFARPQSVASASFALSFSCVGAIFACGSAIERWIAQRIELPARVREGLVLSLATQCGTWPLTAAIFLQFAPYALLANLAVVPCVGATMALGALQLAVAWSPAIAQAAANLDSWPLALMLGAVRTLSSLPGARIPMTPAPAWCYSGLRRRRSQPHRC